MLQGWECRAPGSRGAETTWKAEGGRRSILDSPPSDCSLVTSPKPDQNR